MDQSPTLSQESSKTPSAKQPIVRKWLWIVLGAIIIIALIVVGITRATGDKSNSNIAATPKSSPKVSPTAATSPSTSPASAQANNQTETNENNDQAESNSQNNVETKSWEGTLAEPEYKDLSCTSTISFRYPASYLLSQIGGKSPLSGGLGYIDINSQSGAGTVFKITDASYTKESDYAKIECREPKYPDLTAYYNAYKSAGSWETIGSPTSLTVNGITAMQWSKGEKGKYTAFISSDRQSIIGISLSDVAYINDYNTIINSFEFR